MSTKPVADYLMANETMHPGDTKNSPSGRLHLVWDAGTGILALYDTRTTPWKALWSPGKVTEGADEIIMQHDGNLVAYKGKKALWNTGTYGHPGAYLRLQNDGNMVLYHGKAIWSSNTYNFKPNANVAKMQAANEMTTMGSEVTTMVTSGIAKVPWWGWLGGAAAIAVVVANRKK
jgi:hypothetical protein